MTAEFLLLVFLGSASAAAAVLGALILAAFGKTGWLVIAGLAISAMVVLRLARARLAARTAWLTEDLRDHWRAG